MQFDWNPAKRSKTLSERGIDFADVLAGFLDPDRKVVRDQCKDYGELRYNMLAKVNGRLFHITFTERGEITWIISARKANQREQRRYEQS
ncbi:MAG TPA: BrnT family toxin [Rhodopseudomonas sp.]|uniref:BrnT family toxin n=1 Tax=Rhodopseudomonas sp. TaxID=1078 RepID=UPI002EDB9049